MATPHGSDMSGQHDIQDETVRRNDDEGKPADTGCDDNEADDRSSPVHVGTYSSVDDAEMDKIAVFIQNEIDDDEGCVTDIEVSRPIFFFLLGFWVFGSLGSKGRRLVRNVWADQEFLPARLGPMGSIP